MAFDVEYFRVPGYCLTKMEEVEFLCPRGVMGALYICPNCGAIENKDEHLFEPSQTLLNILADYRSLTRD